jgi:hypothetical protein
VDAANAREIDGGYEVTIEVTAKQFAADGHGKETEEPLDTGVDVAVFAQTDKPLAEVPPLYITKHRAQRAAGVDRSHFAAAGNCDARPVSQADRAQRREITA